MGWGGRVAVLRHRLRVIKHVFQSNFPFQLQLVLCFSPVGATLRRRSRKFPALVNCTAINYFHEWPISALESVSKKFLAKLDVLPVNSALPQSKGEEEEEQKKQQQNHTSFIIIAGRFG